MNKKHIGQRVKLARVFYEQRTGNKMTQEILANKIGTKRGTIGDIELGRSYPSIEMAYKITQACGVTLDFLDYSKQLIRCQTENPTCWGFLVFIDKKISPRFLGGLRRKEVLSFVTVCYFFI